MKVHIRSSRMSRDIYAEKKILPTISKLYSYTSEYQNSFKNQNQHQQILL